MLPLLHSPELNKLVGLTGPQLLLLQYALKTDGAMVREIAENINLRLATITSILDRIVAKLFEVGKIEEKHQTKWYKCFIAKRRCHFKKH